MVNFDARPNKIAKIELDTNAHLEPRSNLNVEFSTADQDTAIFKFMVTQDSKPLLLGEDNIESNIYLKHSNGSHISEKLTITDGLNGEISFQLPNDFGKIPGNVTAQVYVARKGESQAIVAERIFSFTIQESLAWEFDATTKLAYIIEFNELREMILNRQKDIEDAMANAEDYVGQIEQARDKGLSDIEIAKTNSLDELDTLASNKLNEINTKGTQYVEELTDVRNGIDEKINQFNDDVKVGGYVKDSTTSNWQKHKLTQSNGDRIRLSKIDPVELDTGHYQMWLVINAPEGSDTSAQYWNIDVTKAFDDVKQIVATQSYTGRVFQKNIHKGSDLGWKEIPTVSGGNSIETEYGAQNKADTAYSDAIEYFNDTMDANFKSLWKGNVSEKGTVIDLLEPYTEYKMLVVVYYSVGGTKNTSRFTEGLGRIVVQDFNLSDADGGAARFFETALDVVNTSQFRVRHNHTYLPESNTGISNSNAIEYREIVGVK